MPRDSKRLVLRARCEISQIVQGESDRLLVLAGPPAVHDPSAAIEFAARLAAVASKHRGELVVVMQVRQPGLYLQIGQAFPQLCGRVRRSVWCV
jgi:phospho-2-dehydro-3-deoxyheptonate aldolase